MDHYGLESKFVEKIKNKYKKKILSIKKEILPKILKSNIYYTLKANPIGFIKGMILMNNKFEEKGIKLNNMLPLRTEMVPHHIMLDTTCIAELLNNSNKESHEKVWNKFFKNKEIHWNKNKKRVFNNLISTDGYSVSIYQIKSDEYVDKKKLLCKKKEK